MFNLEANDLDSLVRPSIDLIFFAPGKMTRPPARVKLPPGKTITNVNREYF